jgi:hypothetical protein
MSTVSIELFDAQGDEVMSLVLENSKDASELTVYDAIRQVNCETSLALDFNKVVFSSESDFPVRVCDKVSGILVARVDIF